jgi:long-chain fatty acid transport protein
LQVDNALLGGDGLESIEHRSQFGFMILAPAAAFQVSETLAIGFSPQIGYGTFEMEMPWPQPDLQRFGAADLEGKDFAFRWKIGILWQPADWLGFGLAYTSAADLDLKGDIRIKTDTGDLAGLPPQSLQRGDLEMDIGWPESYKAGVFLDFRSRGWPLLALEVQRTNWSRYFDRIPVRFTNQTQNGVPQPDQSFAMAVGMEDQTAYRLGIEIPASDRLAVRLGYTYGRNPVPDTGLLPVINPIVEHHVTLGIGYRLPKGFDINAAAVWGLKNTLRAATPHAVAPDAAGTAVDVGFFAALLQCGYTW